MGDPYGKPGEGAGTRNRVGIVNEKREAGSGIELASLYGENPMKEIHLNSIEYESVLGACQACLQSMVECEDTNYTHVGELYCGIYQLQCSKDVA